MPEAPTSTPLQLTYCGSLKGHKGWVTSIATPSDPTKNYIVSASRGITVAPSRQIEWMDSWWLDGQLQPTRDPSCPYSPFLHVFNNSQMLIFFPLSCR